MAVLQDSLLAFLQGRRSPSYTKWLIPGQSARRRTSGLSHKSACKAEKDSTLLASLIPSDQGHSQWQSIPRCLGSARDITVWVKHQQLKLRQKEITALLTVAWYGSFPSRTSLLVYGLGTAPLSTSDPAGNSQSADTTCQLSLASPARAKSSLPTSTEPVQCLDMCRVRATKPGGPQHSTTLPLAASIRAAVL
jgi:hypothetical protein